MSPEVRLQIEALHDQARALATATAADIMSAHDRLTHVRLTQRALEAERLALAFEIILETEPQSDPETGMVPTHY